MIGKLNLDEDAKIQPGMQVGIFSKTSVSFWLKSSKKVFVKVGAQSKNNLESNWINCPCITDILLPGEAGSYS